MTTGVGVLRFDRCGFDIGWCVVGSRRRSQSLDAHEPCQQHDRDHAGDRRRLLQPAFARLGRLVVVDLLGGHRRDSRSDIVTTCLSGNPFEAAVAAGVVVPVRARRDSVGVGSSASGVATNAVGAESPFPVASRKMDAARTSEVARMCERVPPVDSSALAKSRQRRNLSTGSCESARAKIASKSVRSGRISLGRGGRSLSCLLTTTDRIEVRERRCAGQQVKSTGRQAILIDPAVELLAHQLLRCGIAGASDEHPGAGQRVMSALRARYTEAGQRNSSSVGRRAADQDVAGIDISVQHAAVVRIVQGVGDRRHDFDHQPRRHAVEMAVTQQLGRIRTVDVLRRDPQLVLEFTAVGETGDVRDAKAWPPDRTPR